MPLFFSPDGADAPRSQEAEGSRSRTADRRVEAKRLALPLVSATGKCQWGEESIARRTKRLRRFGKRLRIPWGRTLSAYRRGP
jgi:hypothetical protein